MFKFIRRLFIRLTWERAGSSINRFAHYKSFMLVVMPCSNGGYVWVANIKKGFMYLVPCAQSDEWFVSREQAQRDALKWLRKSIIR